MVGERVGAEKLLQEGPKLVVPPRNSGVRGPGLRGGVAAGGGGRRGRVAGESPRGHRQGAFAAAADRRAHRAEHAGKG
eukprot:scaffold2930_cov244-Pinguiococcus_pyrenoidosus.AAC.13